jgi:RecB family exonuclease
VGHLSYSALAGYERCGYRFYAERVLRLGAPLTQAGPEETADEEDPGEGVPGEVVEPPPSASDANGVARAPLSALERRLALGNAVHAALERSALEAWQRPGDAELRALVASEGLAGDDEAEAEARRLVDAWLDSGLRGCLDGMRLRPEVPFVLAVAGTVVRGNIDLLATAPDRPPVVIDFKTDALRGRDPILIARRYAAQQEVYALAAGTAAEPEGQGALTTVHLFLEAPERPVEREFDPAGLAAARGRLEEIIARMRAGEFAPTTSPDGPTCFGCPAAARLCPHPAWRPPSGG